jgi:NADH-ubiquinone oxidoreductase chain 5
MINFGRWNYIYYLDFLANSFEMDLISLLVILAAMTRSAQIPFSSWLPAAIAAPKGTKRHEYLKITAILLTNNFNT